MSTFKAGDKVVRLQSRFRFIDTIVAMDNDGKRCLLNYAGGQHTWHDVRNLEFPTPENTEYQGASNRVINSTSAY
jgi:hypothetical protein